MKNMRKTTQTLILVGILALVVMTLVLTMMVLGRGATKREAYVRVPDFEGLSDKEAQRLADTNMLQIIFDNESVSHETAPKDTIAEQSPIAGLYVSPGTTVELTRSAGQGNIVASGDNEVIQLIVDDGSNDEQTGQNGPTMPDLLSMSKNEAIAAMAELGISVSVEYVDSVTKPHDTVIAQGISQGSSLSGVSSIVLVMSKNLSAESTNPPASTPTTTPTTKPSATVKPKPTPTPTPTPTPEPPTPTPVPTPTPDLYPKFSPSSGSPTPKPTNRPRPTTTPNMGAVTPIPPSFG